MGAAESAAAARERLSVLQVAAVEERPIGFYGLLAEAFVAYTPAPLPNVIVAPAPEDPSSFLYVEGSERLLAYDHGRIAFEATTLDAAAVLARLGEEAPSHGSTMDLELREERRIVALVIPPDLPDDYRPPLAELTRALVDPHLRPPGVGGVWFPEGVGQFADYSSAGELVGLLAGRYSE